MTDTDSFREQLFNETCRELDRRRWNLRRARFARIAAAVLLFVVGGLCGFALRGARPEVTHLAPTVTEGADETVTDIPGQLVGVTRHTASPPSREDIDREVANSLPTRRRVLLEQAGDSYLAGPTVDPGKAVGYYARLLDELPDDDSGLPKSDDSWLLKYLKLDRQESRQPKGDL